MANLSKDNVVIDIVGQDKASKTFQDVDDKLKGFSKGINDFGAGFLKASGVITGAAVVIKQAFDLGREGAAILQTAASFDMLLAKVGAAPGLLDELRAASKGTVDDMTLMSSTATLLAGASGELATALANNTPQLLEIAKAANKLNPTLGDTTFMYESLATGIKRGSPLILDNLGLTIKLGEANDKFAAKLGKTVEELTAEEQKMALLTATLDAGKVMIDQVGGSTDSATDAFDKLTASTKNITDAMKSKLVPVLAEAAGTLELLLTWQNKLKDAQEKHVGTLMTTAKTVDDLNNGLREQARLNGQLIDKEGNLYIIRRDGGRTWKEVIMYGYLYTQQQGEAILKARAEIAAQNGLIESSKNLSDTTNTLIAGKMAYTEVIKANTESMEKNAEAYLKNIEAAEKRAQQLEEEKKREADRLAAMAASTAQSEEQMKTSFAMAGSLTQAFNDYISALEGAIQRNEDFETAQAAAREALSLHTKELIYQQAAQGLDAFASTQLALAMGLISQADYDVAVGLQKLRAEFDKNRDGMIEAAEGADVYTQKVLRLTDAVIAYQNATKITQVPGSTITGATIGGVTQAANPSGVYTVGAGQTLTINYQPTLSTASSYELSQALAPIVQPWMAQAATASGATLNRR